VLFFQIDVAYMVSGITARMLPTPLAAFSIGLVHMDVKPSLLLSLGIWFPEAVASGLPRSPHSLVNAWTYMRGDMYCA